MKNKKFVASAVSAALVASVVAPVVADAATGKLAAGSVSKAKAAKITITDVKPEKDGNVKVYYKRSGASSSVSKTVKADYIRHLGTYALFTLNNVQYKWDFSAKTQLTAAKSFGKHIALADQEATAGNATTAKQYLENAQSHYNTIVKNSELYSPGTITNYKERLDEVAAKVDSLAGKVTAINATTVEVTFNKEISDVNALNFAIEGLTIQKVEVKADNKNVAVLTTSPMEVGKTYTVTESGVTLGTVQLEVSAQAVTLKADNLKEINASFVNEIDAKTINGESVKLSVNGSAKSINSYYTLSVSDDKKEVVITVKGESEHFNQGDKVTVEFKGVKNADGTAFPDGKHEFVVTDTTAPTVTEVKVAGLNKLEVVFSEPLEEQPTVKVNNGSISSVVSSFKKGGKSLIVSTSALTEGTTYKVAVEGGKDYAGLVIGAVENDVIYEVVRTAPTVTVKSSDSNSVTLKFNRPVENFQSQTTFIRHTYDSSTNEVIGNSTSVEKISDSEYKVTFPEAKPFPPGTTKLYISYANGLADAAKIKDLFGNVLQATSLDVTTVVDTTKPTVSEVSYDKDTKKVVVKFSEDVVLPTINSFTLKDKNGNVVAIETPAFTRSGTTDVKNSVEFGLYNKPNGLDAGTYTLEVKNVTDTSIGKNQLDTVTQAFTIGDVVAPQISKVFFKDATKKTIRVVYSEAVNEVEALTKTNYFIKPSQNGNATVLNANATITKVNNYTFDITLPEALADGSYLYVNGLVQDLASNKLGNGSGSQAAIQEASQSAVTKTDISKVTAEAKNKITFVIGQEIKETTLPIGTNGLQVKANNTEIKATSATAVRQVDGTTLVTVLLDSNTALGTDGKQGEHNVTIDIAANVLTNTLDQKNSQISSVSVDNEKIVAEIASATAQAGGSGSQGIQITFTEAVKYSSVQTSDFQVEGYVVEDIKFGDTNTAGKNVTLTIRPVTTESTTTKTVKLVGDVEDVNGNVGYNSTAQATSITGTVIAAAPQLTGVIVPQGGFDAVGDTLELVFDQAIAFGDELSQQTGVAVDILDDFLFVNYDGNDTTDDTFHAQGSTATFDFAIDPSDNKKLKITLQTAGLSQPITSETTINIIDVSNIVAALDNTKASVAATSPLAVTDKSSPTLVSSTTTGGFDAENDTMVLTFDENVQLNTSDDTDSAIITNATTLTGVPLDFIKDLVTITGKTLETSAGTPTFDIAVSDKTVTITLKGSGATLRNAIASENVKVNDVSNIVDKVNNEAAGNEVTNSNS